MKDTACIPGSIYSPIHCAWLVKYMFERKNVSNKFFSGKYNRYSTTPLIRNDWDGEPSR